MTDIVMGLIVALVAVNALGWMWWKAKDIL